MKITLTGFLLGFSLTLNPAQAEPNRVDFSSIEALRLSETQVQDLFSLFLSRLPMLLNDTEQSEHLVEDLAPQALQLLNAEQKRMLHELLPPDDLENFSSMSREERSRFLFESARTLVHPSKAEWLNRVEEMTR